MASVFRKKSLDRISSPEDLHEFIHATNPGLWIVIIAVIVLLIGAIVWGATGSIETKARCSVYVKRTADAGKTENGYGLVLYTDSDNIPQISEYLSAHGGRLDLRTYMLDPEGQTVEKYYALTGCELDLSCTFIGYPDDAQEERGDYSEKAARLMGFSSGDIVYLVFGSCASIREDLGLAEDEDTVLSAEIMLESIHPLKFVFN